MAVKPIEIGLVLQGGGALGAYECGAILALLELMEEAQANGHPVELKAVIGVSIGAINAACVVGSHSPADARRRLGMLWDELTIRAPIFWPLETQRDVTLFGLPGFYKIRTDYLTLGTWTSYYDTSPLLATLARHIDFAALNESATMFVASAVDVESGRLTRFCNRVFDGTPPVTVTPRHVMASGSLPPQFPWTEINRRYYWDGALVNNTPLGDAIDAFSHGKDIDRVLVVMDLYPLSGLLPRNMPEVEDRIHELAFGNRLRQDHLIARQINELIKTIEQLSAVVPAADMTPALQDRVDRAHEYKVITIVDIDMQMRLQGNHPARQESFDNNDGLRDFSASTVARRRAQGHSTACESLLPIFTGRGLISPDQAKRISAPARS